MSWANSIQEPFFGYPYNWQNCLDLPHRRRAQRRPRHHHFAVVDPGRGRRRGSKTRDGPQEVAPALLESGCRRGGRLDDEYVNGDILFATVVAHVERLTAAVAPSSRSCAHHSGYPMIRLRSPISTSSRSSRRWSRAPTMRPCHDSKDDRLTAGYCSTSPQEDHPTRRRR